MSADFKKLQALYVESQKYANSNIQKLSRERITKICKLADKEYNNALKNEDLAILEEIAFYKERFNKMYQLFDEAARENYKKSKYESEVQNIFKQSYHNQNQIVEDKNQTHNAQSRVANQKVTYDMLSTFFQSKFQEIDKSKVGFKSVLENFNSPIQKRFEVKKQNLHVNSTYHGSSDEIRKLQNEIRELTNKLNQKNIANEFKAGLSEVEKKVYEQRIEVLQNQIYVLNQEKEQLKSEKSIRHINYEQYRQDKGQNRYGLNIRENDIDKINYRNKNISMKSYLTEQKPKAQLKFEKEVENPKNNHINFESLGDIQSYDSKNQQIQRPLQIGYNDDYRNKKINIFTESKLCFFKTSGVIYRGRDFQITIKKQELINREQQRITICVNNKSYRQLSVNINYNSNPTYHDLTVLKRIKAIPAGKEEKEEINVKLNHIDDLDDLIEANLIANGIEIQFLIPALFIEFSNEHSKITEKMANCKINPLYQFSKIHLAQQFLALERFNEEGRIVGKIYGRSRDHQGQIKLHWKHNGSFYIETIQPWKLLLSYLLGNIC